MILPVKRFIFYYSSFIFCVVHKELDYFVDNGFHSIVLSSSARITIVAIKVEIIDSAKNSMFHLSIIMIVMLITAVAIFVQCFGPRYKKVVDRF